MSTENVPSILNPYVTATMHFGASKEFHMRSDQQDADSSFLGYERRPWLQGKSNKNLRMEKQAMISLLSSYTSRANVEKLINEKIGYRDLGSLTDEDLEYFGLARRHERSDLMNLFKQLPNQDPSYEHICDKPNANVFNDQIVGNASNHIIYMRSAMAATYYKLHVMPPDDVLVGDKYYASHFALEVLKSVQSITAELDKDMNKLKQLICDNNQKNTKNTSTPAKGKNFKLHFTALALGSACAWFWWWSKNSNSFSFHNISLKM